MLPLFNLKTTDKFENAKTNVIILLSDKDCLSPLLNQQKPFVKCHATTAGIVAEIGNENLPLTEIFKRSRSV